MAGLCFFAALGSAAQTAYQNEGYFSKKDMQAPLLLTIAGLARWKNGQNNRLWRDSDALDDQLGFDGYNLDQQFNRQTFKMKQKVVGSVACTALAAALVDHYVPLASNGIVHYIAAAANAGYYVMGVWDGFAAKDIYSSMKGAVNYQLWQRRHTRT